MEQKQQPRVGLGVMAVKDGKVLILQLIRQESITGMRKL
jgi:hypothetical protein